MSAPRGRPARARARARRRTREARSRRPSRRSGGGGSLPRGHLEAQARTRGQQGQHGVGRGRGPQLHPVEVAERAHQVAAAPLELVRRPLVVARRPPHLGRQLGLARAREPGRVLLVHLVAHLAQEAQVPVARLAAHRLQLVAEDGREPHRHRRAVQHLEQRQVDAGHGLPEPLLAEGPRAEALHVGHVGVQDEGQRPAAKLTRGHLAEHRYEVERALEVRRCAGRSRGRRWRG